MKHVWVILDDLDIMVAADQSFLRAVRYVMLREDALQSKRRLHLRRGLLFGVIVAVPTAEYTLIRTEVNQ